MTENAKYLHHEIAQGPSIIWREKANNWFSVTNLIATGFQIGFEQLDLAMLTNSPSSLTQE